MQMMHVTDWLPTIVNLAQGKITKEIDGFDQWKTLQGDVLSPRKEILLNIDHEVGEEGLILDQWKIIKESKLFHFIISHFTYLSHTTNYWILIAFYYVFQPASHIIFWVKRLIFHTFRNFEIFF